MLGGARIINENNCYIQTWRIYRIKNLGCRVLPSLTNRISSQSFFIVNAITVNSDNSLCKGSTKFNVSENGTRKIIKQDRRNQSNNEAKSIKTKMEVVELQPH